MVIRATESASVTFIDQLAVEANRAGFVLVQRRPDPSVAMSFAAIVVVWAPEGGAVRRADTTIEIAPGQFLVVNPGESMALESGAAADARMNVACLGLDFVNEVYADLREASHIIPDSGKGDDEAPRPSFDPSPRLQPASLRMLLGDLDQAASLGLQDGGWLSNQLRLLCERLLWTECLSRRPRRRRPGRSRHELLLARLHRVRTMIETNYDQPIDLDTMAASACVSRFHFLREFRKAFGETPYRLLIKRRLEVARQLLTARDLTVQEISRRVGFATPDGFYRAFRRRYKGSPSAYRAVR